MGGGAGLSVAVIVALDASSGPERDERGRIATPTEARPDALEVGDCVSGIAEGEVTSVRAVPCDEPGSGKVFATFELSDGEWPGDAKVDELAGEGCSGRYQASGDEPAEVLFLRPTADSWSLGDRRVVCVAVPAS